MKSKINSELIYSLIYYSIAIATAKHSAWSYSTAMEGPMPDVNWAAFNLNIASGWALLQLVVWFAWGLLAAVAIDVGIYMLAKQIREAVNKDMLAKYVGYSLISLFSAYFQVMYALQHASSFSPVDGVPLWVNEAYVWRFLIVPISLPVVSIIYTVLVKIDMERNRPVLGRKEESMGEKVYTVREAAAYTGLSEATIRQREYAARDGKSDPFGFRDEKGKAKFTQSELDTLKNLVKQ